MKNPFDDNAYLARQCLAGDRRAQRYLYDKHKSKVMGLLRRYTASASEAQDIFQESFVIIFRQLGKLENYHQLEGWIKTIAIRTAINAYHKRKNGLIVVNEEKGIDTSDESFEKTIEHMDMDHLLAIINTLPDGYRLVFNLYVMEGYSHAEIGEFLSISAGTSKSQLSRAKEIIKRHLSQLGITKYTKYA